MNSLSARRRQSQRQICVTFLKISKFKKMIIFAKVGNLSIVNVTQILGMGMVWDMGWLVGQLRDISMLRQLEASFANEGLRPKTK